jgi:cytidylate kinase
MSVITVSGEFGSDASQVARQVAQSLGYHYVDRAIIEKILDEYGLVQFRDMYESISSIWTRFDTLRGSMTEMLNRTIQAVARHGNVVIQGRGGFAVLAGFADVLHVRIQAPLPLRVARVMQRTGLTDRAQAEAEVRQYDRVRSTFVEYSYHVPWNNTDAFNLVIDTGVIPPERAVEWIIQAHHFLAARDMTEAPLARAIEFDKVLDGVVATALSCTTTHS